jgi:predicted nuclease with TOPRIM domain
MSDELPARLTRLEDAVRRAGETLVRLREENERLRRDMRRLDDERRQVVGQIDAILKDIGRLDLGDGQ